MAGFSFYDVNGINHVAVYGMINRLMKCLPVPLVLKYRERVMLYPVKV